MSLENCINCNEELVNGNCSQCTDCEGEETCCTEIDITDCITHDGDNLKTIIDELVAFRETLFNTQNIGGLPNTEMIQAINDIIDSLTLIIVRVYDLSNIDVGGNPGSASASADVAITHLINKIEEEHQ